MNEAQRIQHKRAVKNISAAININAGDIELTAREQVKAASRGVKVLCRRVKNWVDMNDCADLYFAACAKKKPANPCWQCAKVRAWMKRESKNERLA